jgi:hypothetical protein
MNQGPGIQDKSRHHNVASSERLTLRSRRNQQFHDLSHAKSSKDNNKDKDDCSCFLKHIIRYLYVQFKETKSPLTLLIGSGNQSTDESGDDDEEDEKHAPRLATYESDCNSEVDNSDGKGNNKIIHFISRSCIFVSLILHMLLGVDEEDEIPLDLDIIVDATPIADEADPYDYVYNNLPESEHVLPEAKDCVHCGAKKFHKEPPGFCYRSGQVELMHHDTPELVRLWESSDADARHFRDHVRWFNSHFTFTSLYCSLDVETTDMRKGNGIYTFRAHGGMYHNIRGFIRENCLERSHLELYFYDNDPTLQHRYRCARKEQEQKDKEIIEALVDILKGNPHSEKLKSMGEIENVDEYVLHII